jgi:tRNA/tmRNA/rRNA uracil-C5-methylase (TrmA/RlmC/RlmD family)
MVRGRSASPKIGIFQAGSHRITDIPRCRIHHPLVNQVAAAVRAAVRETGVSPYADRPHRGDLRAVQVVVERAGPRAQVVLVGNAERPEPLLPVAERLERELGAALQGLFWNGNPERTNAILGPAWRHLAGEAMVRERIGGADVFYPPGAFGQSHLELAEALAGRIRERVPPEAATAAELYAGCGAIGLGLAARGVEVRFNESNPHALAGLARGIAALPAAARTRVEAGEAGQALALLEGADAVIVDPPRRGLDAALVERLASRPPPVLLYASCDLGSLERDAAAVCGAGRLALAQLEAWNLFPFTAHVETLAVFRAV